MAAELKFAEEFLLGSCLKSTNYEVKRIVELFHSNCKKFAEQLGDGTIEKVSVDEIDGKGFCSIIFKIKLAFNNGKDDVARYFTFIAKVCSDQKWNDLVDEASRFDPEKSKQLIQHIHNCECDAYELLQQIRNIPVPEIYYLEKADSKNMGIILMEDVGLFGRSMDDSESVTKEQCFEIARILADFQTQIHFLKDQSWRSKFYLNPPTHEIVDIGTNSMMSQVLNIEDEELRSYIKTFYEMDKKQLAKFALEEFTGQFGVNTLAHGDFWSNNLFFKFNQNDQDCQDGTVSNEVASIIDWQIALIANPMFDLCSFIVLCSNVDVRQNYEKQVIDFYYDQLSAHFEKHGEKPKFTREQAHEFYKVALTHTIVAFILTLSTFIVSYSQKEEDQQKYQTLLERLRAAFKDAQPILKKYNMVEKFTSKNDVVD